jgi:prephenate dehydratase
MNQISIQGQFGSFHHIASKYYFKKNTAWTCRDTFKEVFKDVDSGKVDYGFVAIENSLFGSINEVYDLLLKYKLWIAGEVYLRIQHCLVSLPNTALNNIEEVHSHPVALAQCEEFLDQYLPQAERFEHHDTAGAAADILKWNNPAKAAIASAEAAQLHGLKMLKSEIETNKQNYTRFIVLQNTKNKMKTKNLKQLSKTSIVLELAERPGILYEALGAFANRKINLNKVESRPIIGKAWHYMFYLDFEAAANSANGRAALKELSNNGNKVTVLGSYPKGQLFT